MEGGRIGAPGEGTQSMKQGIAGNPERRDGAAEGSESSLELAECLGRHYLFHSLGPGEIRHIAEEGRLLRVGENETVFAQGDPADRFFLVVEGIVRLYLLSPEGNEKIVEIVESGQTFAEATAFFNQPHYPVWAATLTPCVLAAVGSRTYVDAITRSPRASRELMGALSRRLHFLIAQINELALKNATARVAGYLLSRLAPDTPEIDLHLSKRTLACYLSLQPETFSRILKYLNDEGVIRLRARYRATICAQSVSCGRGA